MLLNDCCPRCCFRITRRTLASVSALGVVVIVVGFLFRYDVTGWFQGESAYRGRPTCEWSAALQRRSPRVTFSDSDDDIERVWWREPTTWERFLAWSFTGKAASGETDLVDPDAIPVLTELLREWNPHVRRIAADALGRIGRNAAGAESRLVETVEDDPNPDVRAEAKRALHLIDPATW